MSGGQWLMPSVLNHPTAERGFYAYFICISLKFYAIWANGSGEREAGNRIKAPKNRRKKANNYAMTIFKAVCCPLSGNSPICSIHD